jgi:hypothetical protein
MICSQSKLVIGFECQCRRRYFEDEGVGRGIAGYNVDFVLGSGRGEEGESKRIQVGSDVE